MDTNRETTWTNVFKIMISNGPKTLAKIPVQTQTQKRIDLSSTLKEKISELNRIKPQITSKPTFSPPMKQDERSSTWITIFNGLKKINPKLLDPANTNVLVRDQKELIFSPENKQFAKTLPISKTNLITDANANANTNQQSIQQMVQVNNLQTQIDNMKNHFKLEKAQMEIMFGMKMDLIKKQHEHHIQDTIANGNSSNGDLVEQINNLKEQISNLEEEVVNNVNNVNNVKDENTRLKDENIKLKDENTKLLQSNNKTDQTKTDTTGTTGDNEKIAQLQTRVMKLTQELLIIKMNENLQKQKYANVKPTAAPPLPEIDRTKFSKRDSKQLNINGGAFKKQLFMKGGAPTKSVIQFDEDKEILVIFDKTDRSLVFQIPTLGNNEENCVYLTEKDIDEYNKKLKELKDEIDALKKLLPTPPVATPNSDTINKLTLKLALLKTLYANQHKEIISAQIANASNLRIQSKLTSSLTNANAITDLTKEKDDLKAENAVLTTENNNLKTENNNLKTENNNLKTENNNLKTNKTQLEANKTQLEADKTTLESAKTTLESAKTQLETENAGLKAEKTVLESEKTALESEKTALKAENANLTTRLNTTTTSSGMSTAISNANATLRRNPKGFISDNGRVMFSEHK
jgi:chromosome segregation ATPase